MVNTHLVRLTVATLNLRKSKKRLSWLNIFANLINLEKLSSFKKATMVGTNRKIIISQSKG